ncbi:MAG TPA: Crp/Fnr family transcriptional regulator [Bacteroidia bacterium]|jgi:CRP-like cAMP-binding protein|nr:Crp/Fnr family transcriptional regulator [Bacteroidia bacterium]
MENFFKYLSENAGITPGQFNILKPLLQVKNIVKGKYILTKGEVCSHSFFVEKGLLRMYSINKEGKENIIQFASENWFISDRSSAFFHEPSQYNIDAVEDTAVVLIDAKFMTTALEISPEFRSYNENLLQNHIRHLQGRITLLIGASAEERYMNFIKLYSDLTLRVPQWMIASYLGITPESLSRVRKELAKQHFKGY